MPVIAVQGTTWAYDRFAHFNLLNANCNAGKNAMAEMYCWLTLPRRRAVALTTTFAGGLLAGCTTASSSADQRAVALDKAIPPAMQSASVPGALVGVWQDGRPPYVRAFGVADTETGQPMKTDMHMRIGSNSKTFAVTSMLMLADRGKLRLDDTIDRYVAGVPGGNRITLRQLAQMRSGLADYLDVTSQEWPYHPFRQWTPQELLPIAFHRGLRFPPGTKFDYCNTNTVLVGAVVEKVSGQSLPSFIDQNISTPEGLTHTIFPVGAEIPSPYSHGYLKMPGGRVADATHWNYSWGWGSGSMISTLDDMRKWVRVLATGKLLSPAMKAAQQQFLPAPGEGDGALYGLALENQNGWLGHNGNPLSCMIYPYYLPDEHITMIVWVNSAIDVPATWRLMQIVAPVVSPSHPWTGLPKE